jgi:toxin ParE1/3/4
MVALRYSHTSLADLKAIHDFIAKDSVANAKRFITELRQHISVLKKHPEFGFPLYPGRYKNLRQVLYKSYRIIYLFEQNVVYIITICHQHRLPGNIPVLTQFET